MLTSDAIQFNLTPENDHERDFMGMLSGYTGEVSVSQGANVAMSRGGYLRSYDGGGNTTAITIQKPSRNA